MSTMTEKDSSSSSDQSQQDIVTAYAALNTDEKLALLHCIYKKIGTSVVPNVPQGATSEVSPLLLSDFFQLSDEDQLVVMREIVEGQNTEYSSVYGALPAERQLVVWYTWAQGMGSTAISLPSDYQPTDAMKQLLVKVESLPTPPDQIAVLRSLIKDMGYCETKTS